MNSLVETRALAAVPDRVAPLADRSPGWIQTLFLGFAFLVLQGAFIDMATSARETASAESSDIRHMLAFAVLLFGTAILAPKHWRGMVAAAGANLPYFILPAILLASVLWSVEPALTLKRSVLTVGVCVFDLYVATTIGLNRLLRLLSVTVLLSAVASIVLAVALPTIGREMTEGLTGDWRGAFSQKNTLGHVMSIGVFVEIGLMIRARRLLAGGCVRAAIYLVLVVMAHSVSSLLSVTLAIIGAILYVSFRRGLATTAICVLVAVGIVALVGGTIGTNPSVLFELLDRDPSLTGRTDLWFYVLDAIREKPLFGWGYMAFWTPDGTSATYIQNQIRWPAPNAHNGYLELALGLGLVGLAGLAATGLWTVRRIVASTAGHADLAALLAIISLQMLVANLTESFMISSSVFGWNVFSIIVLMTGRNHQPWAPADHTGRASLLARAKPKA